MNIKNTILCIIMTFNLAISNCVSMDSDVDNPMLPQTERTYLELGYKQLSSLLKTGAIQIPGDYGSSDRIIIFDKNGKVNILTLAKQASQRAEQIFDGIKSSEYIFKLEKNASNKWVLNVDIPAEEQSNLLESVVSGRYRASNKDNLFTLLIMQNISREYAISNSTIKKIKSKIFPNLPNIDWQTSAPLINSFIVELQIFNELKKAHTITEALLPRIQLFVDKEIIAFDSTPQEKQRQGYYAYLNILYGILIYPTQEQNILFKLHNTFEKFPTHVHQSFTNSRTTARFFNQDLIKFDTVNFFDWFARNCLTFYSIETRDGVTENKILVNPYVISSLALHLKEHGHLSCNLEETEKKSYFVLTSENIPLQFFIHNLLIALVNPTTEVRSHIEHNQVVVEFKLSSCKIPELVEDMRVYNYDKKIYESVQTIRMIVTQDNPWMVRIASIFPVNTRFNAKSIRENVRAIGQKQFETAPYPSDSYLKYVPSNAKMQIIQFCPCLGYIKISNVILEAQQRLLIKLQQQNVSGEHTAIYMTSAVNISKTSVFTLSRRMSKIDTTLPDIETSPDLILALEELTDHYSKS